MCGNPFSSSSGGSSASQSASTSQQSVQVNVSTPVNISTGDLSDAIKALAQTRVQSAQYALLGSVAGAAATVKAAQIAAGSGPNLYVVGGAIIAVLGLLFTAGIVKVPRALRA
jgi:hypothetical protein